MKKKKWVVASTPFSNFIRNASVEEKTAVYLDVLAKATERQQALMEQYERSRNPRGTH